MLIDHHSLTVEGYIYVTSDHTALRFGWSVSHAGGRRPWLYEVLIGEATVFPNPDGSLSYRGKERDAIRAALAEFPNATSVPVVVTEIRTVSRKPA